MVVELWERTARYVYGRSIENGTTADGQKSAGEKKN